MKEKCGGTGEWRNVVLVKLGPNQLYGTFCHVDGHGVLILIKRFPLKMCGLGL